MGVVKPPWITEEWFAKCPFNYCDHFGDIEVLVEFCKICKEGLKFKLEQRDIEEDFYNIKFVSQEEAENAFEKKELRKEKAKKLNTEMIDWYDEYDFKPPAEIHLIFNLAKNYGDYVEKIVENLFLVPIDSNKILIEKSLDCLLHSRSYVFVKVRRALSSRWEEKDRPIMSELADSKTSALFSYMAVKRNSKALLALSKHKPLKYLKEKHLKFAALSIDLAEMISQEFFPNCKLDYEEVGCDSYNEIFK